MDTQREYEMQIEKLLSEWQRIYENGDVSGSEVPDGFILNRIREEMLETVQKLADKDGASQEKYLKQVPGIMEAGYMARADEIRRRAAAFLETVRMGAAYQSLAQLRRQEGKESGVSGMEKETGLAGRLADAVERDDLCQMRCLIQSGKIYEQMNAGLEILVKQEKKKRERQKRLFKRGQITGQYSIYDISA